MTPVVGSTPTALAGRPCRRFKRAHALRKKVAIPPAASRGVPLNFTFRVANREQRFAQGIRCRITGVGPGCPNAPAPQRDHIGTESSGAGLSGKSLHGRFVQAPLGCEFRVGRTTGKESSRKACVKNAAIQIDHWRFSGSAGQLASSSKITYMRYMRLSITHMRYFCVGVGANAAS